MHTLSHTDAQMRDLIGSAVLSIEAPCIWSVGSVSRTGRGGAGGGGGEGGREEVGLT